MREGLKEDSSLASRIHSENWQIDNKIIITIFSNLIISHKLKEWAQWPESTIYSIKLKVRSKLEWVVKLKMFRTLKIFRRWACLYLLNQKSRTPISNFNSKIMGVAMLKLKSNHFWADWSTPILKAINKSWILVVVDLDSSIKGISPTHSQQSIPPILPAVVVPPPLQNKVALDLVHLIFPKFNTFWVTQTVYKAALHQPSNPQIKNLRSNKFNIIINQTKTLKPIILSYRLLRRPILSSLIAISQKSLIRIRFSSMWNHLIKFRARRRVLAA